VGGDGSGGGGLSEHSSSTATPTPGFHNIKYNHGGCYRYCMAEAVSLLESLAALLLEREICLNILKF
jgi:hypothetical protein